MADLFKDLMRIIISAPYFDWGDMAECLRQAVHKLGLDGVEVSWSRSFERPHCTQEDIDVLIGACEKDHLTLGAHIWEDLAQSTLEEGRKNLLDWLDLCGKTRVRNLVLHGGSSPNQEDGIVHTRHILEGVLSQFERAGVVLNLENHYSYDYHDCHELFSEAWEFLQVLSLDSPSLGFCFDTGHANMTRNSDTLIRSLGPWLHYVHLADNQGIDDDHAMFRQGTVDWNGVFEELERTSFDGIFCVEFPVHKEVEPLNKCVQEIRTRWTDADNTIKADKQ